MTWTITAYLFDTLRKAIANEPRAYSADAREASSALFTIGLQIAEGAKLPWSTAQFIACHLPTFEPDEEQAVAEVRQAYAALRRVKEREAAGVN